MNVSMQRYRRDIYNIYIYISLSSKLYHPQRFYNVMMACLSRRQTNVCITQHTRRKTLFSSAWFGNIGVNFVQVYFLGCYTSEIGSKSGYKFCFDSGSSHFYWHLCFDWQRRKPFVSWWHNPPSPLPNSHFNPLYIPPSIWIIFLYMWCLCVRASFQSFISYRVSFKKKISWLPPRFAWKLYVIIHGRYFCFTPQRQMLAWDSVVGAGREREWDRWSPQSFSNVFFYFFQTEMINGKNWATSISSIQRCIQFICSMWKDKFSYSEYSRRKSQFQCYSKPTQY